MKVINRVLRLLLVVLPVCICVPAQAQLIRGYGLKAGLTSSDVRSSDLFEGDPFNEYRHRRTGFSALFFVEWLDASSFSVVTETGYVQRGFYVELEFRDPQNNPVDTFKISERFDYLSTVVLAKLRYDVDAMAPYVLAGPHLNLLLGGEPDEEGSFADTYAPLAWGGTVGVGTEVARLLPVPLFLEVRYSFDVTNSLPDAPRDVYNNAFDLLVGIRL